MNMRDYIEERIERIPFSGCWIWMRSAQKQGYGDFRMDGKHYLTHRASYELANGPIPHGLHVLHRCDVRSCCNPEHLFVGTNQDNIADSVAKGRRTGITRLRPSGLVYKWNEKSKLDWIENKRVIKKETRQQIKEEYATNKKTTRKLAAQYGVTCATISRIINEPN